MTEREWGQTVFGFALGIALVVLLLALVPAIGTLVILGGIGLARLLLWVWLEEPWVFLLTIVAGYALVFGIWGLIASLRRWYWRGRVGS